VNKRIFLVFIFALALVLPVMIGASPVAHGAAATATKKAAIQPYTRIFYARSTKAAEDSLHAHPGSIDVLAPQAYSVDANGTLTGSVSSSILAFVAAHGIKVMPLVVNQGFGAAGYQALLDDPAKQKEVIAALAAEAKKNGYWGWQLDFEQMDAAYRGRFSAFAAKAHEALQRQGLILSVAAVAQVSENPADYKNDLWQKLIGAYDYRALALGSDFVSVMSYDDPESKGPVAEFSWLQRVLAFSLKSIPAQKLSLGIPFYYWQWDNATGKRVAIGNNTGLDKLIAAHKVAYAYSTKQQAPYFTFKDKKKSYTVWYENGRSIRKKVDLVRSYGLHGFSAWALGQEVPSVHQAFSI